MASRVPLLLFRTVISIVSTAFYLSHTFVSTNSEKLSMKVQKVRKLEFTQVRFRIIPFLALRLKVLDISGFNQKEESWWTWRCRIDGCILYFSWYIDRQGVLIALMEEKKWGMVLSRTQATPYLWMCVCFLLPTGKYRTDWTGRTGQVIYILLLKCTMR